MLPAGRRNPKPSASENKVFKSNVAGTGLTSKVEEEISAVEKGNDDLMEKKFLKEIARDMKHAASSENQLNAKLALATSKSWIEEVESFFINIFISTAIIGVALLLIIGLIKTRFICSKCGCGKRRNKNMELVMELEARIESLFGKLEEL